MPAEMDLYFPPEDNEYEVKYMPNAAFRAIKSVWGHFAGGGVNAADTKFIDDSIKELLASEGSDRCQWFKGAYYLPQIASRSHRSSFVGWVYER